MMVWVMVSALCMVEDKNIKDYGMYACMATISRGAFKTKEDCEIFKNKEGYERVIAHVDGGSSTCVQASALKEKQIKLFHYKKQ